MEVCEIITIDGDFFYSFLKEKICVFTTSIDIWFYIVFLIINKCF